MTIDEFNIDWESKFTESLLESFTCNKFIIFDNLFTQQDLIALQTESGFIKYQEANLTAGKRFEEIRGDQIHWITKQDNAGYKYLTSINQLGQFCNKIFYTGIHYCEAHYACYPKGLGYKWHRDNPKDRNERILSAVFYLNEEWVDTDGGALEIVNIYGEHHLILPKANRLVLFDSNLLHQVHISHRKRFSIATWLRRN